MSEDTKELVKYMSLVLGTGAVFVAGINMLQSMPIEKPEYKYVTHMKASDAESVMAIITAEGFDQAFNHYSTYKDINDTKFHDLRKAYIAASKELAEYIAESAGKVNNIPYYMSHESRN